MHSYKKTHIAGLALLAGLWLSGLSQAQDCEPVDGIQSICGLSEPEDIVRAPNGRDLIFGQMNTPGGVHLLNTSTNTTRPLFGEGARTPVLDPTWGQAECTAPPSEIHAHGLHIGQLDSGEYRVLLVNHNERESVEMFEFVHAAPGYPASLIWRGCALAPPEGSFNDVAGLPNGDFLVTHMSDLSSQTWDLFLAMLGRNSGYVYRWNAEAGFTKMPGSDSRFPNGITVAPDGQSYFLNIYLGDEVRQHDMATGEVLGRWDIDKPDNSEWTDDGKLWIASHPVSVFDLMSAMDARDGTPSYLAFAIVEIDPATQAQREVLRREGPPMGAGTVAVQQGESVYIGSFLGDRIIQVPLAEDN